MAVTFFFENPKMGGGHGVILHLSKYLTQQGEKVKLAMHPQSPVRNKLTELGIDHTFISTHDIASGKDVDIDENDVLVVFHLSTILRNLMRKNPRIVFYNIFPDHILKVNDYKLGIEFNRKTRRLIQKMAHHHSLFFMDSEGVDELWKRYEMELEAPIYLPVPIDDFGEAHYQVEPFPKQPHCLTLTYVGRAEEWKIYPLQKVLDDLSGEQRFSNYRVIIVTDSKTDFEKLLKAPADLSIKLEFRESLFGSELEQLLLAESDLHIGMGLACMEGAKLGIPSLLVDPSAQRLPANYRYRWLYESKGFSLGTIIDPAKKEFPGVTFGEILDQLAQPDYRQAISKKGHNYVYRNHSASECGRKFLDAINVADLRLHELRRLVIYFSSFHQIVRGASAVLNKGKDGYE